MITYLYHRSGKLLISASATGVISGLAGAALIAVISKGLQESADRAVLAWTILTKNVDALSRATLYSQQVTAIAPVRALHAYS